MSDCECATDDEVDEILDNSQYSLPFKPILPNFLSETLLAVQYMQLKTESGPTIIDIASFMKKTFHLSGDVLSQVGASLREAVESGYVVEMANRYFPVGAFARIQRAESAERMEIAQEMLKDFLYKPTTGRKVRKQRLKLTKKRSEELLAILDDLRDMLMKRTKSKIKKEPPAAENDSLKPFTDFSPTVDRSVGRAYDLRKRPPEL